MAKAALNMTNEDPAENAARKVVDGAARIVAPIVRGFNTGTHAWGQFLKYYKPTVW